MSEWGSAAQRIGDEERNAAVAALDVHRQSGRLDPAEYEERQVSVSRARTWADVAPLFVDLPEPHPVGMPKDLPIAVPPSGQAPLAQPATGGSPVPSGGLLGGVVPEQYRSTVMALIPFAAVLLFFVTGSWFWFLGIPIMAILLYGAEGKDERRRDRDRKRRS